MKGDFWPLRWVLAQVSGPQLEQISGAHDA